MDLGIMKNFGTLQVSSCISEREVGVWDGGWRGGLGIWDFSVLASLTLRRETETVLFQILFYEETVFHYGESSGNRLLAKLRGLEGKHFAKIVSKIVRSCCSFLSSGISCGLFLSGTASQIQRRPRVYGIPPLGKYQWGYSSICAHLVVRAPVVVLSHCTVAMCHSTLLLPAFWEGSWKKILCVLVANCFQMSLKHPVLIIVLSILCRWQILDPCLYLKKDFKRQFKENYKYWKT